ncbi:MAG: MotA/TolQ/ExbB proton channel family protein [Nitrospiraceae bacterium]
MTLQAGPMGLVGSLGLVSKVVLLLLFFFSVVSWAVILYKWRVFRTADRKDQQFLTAYAKTKDKKGELRWAAKRVTGSPSAAVFVGIMDRLVAHPESNDGGEEEGTPDRQYVDRVVAHLVQDQVGKLEAYLPFLATTGNISPFIGLLGTVMGIIDSFREIGVQGTASIAAVAPGVSEALVATAAGLFAAIPAVIAYNYYLTRIRRTVFRLETFSVELLNVLQSRVKPVGVGVKG